MDDADRDVATIDAGQSLVKLEKDDAPTPGIKATLLELTAPIFERYQADQELKARELDLRERELDLDSQLEQRELDVRAELRRLQHERKLAQIRGEARQRTYGLVGFLAVLGLAGAAIRLGDHEAARLLIVAVLSGGAGVAYGEHRGLQQALAGQARERED